MIDSRFPKKLKNILYKLDSELPKIEMNHKKVFDFNNADLIAAIHCYVLNSKDRLLVVKRSDKVGSFRNLWFPITGMYDQIVNPGKMALEELEEEVGILEDQISEVRYCSLIQEQAFEKDWIIATCIAKVEMPQIILNYENTDFKWIKISEIDNWITIAEVANVAKRSLAKFNL
jgi:isopentenyldiphosphate isomerase